MKNTLISLILAANISGIHAQKPVLTPGQAVREALNNRENIAAAKTEYLIAKSITTSVKKELIPQLSAAYNYRYSFVSPSQIIPVGLFFPVPTDEKRAIQFGTAWQQGAGVTLYLPFFDIYLLNRIKESGINERISNVSLKIAEEELAAEVIKSFISVYSREMMLRSATEDTLRTANIKNNLYRRFSEGRVTKTELNVAEISHRKALEAYRSAHSWLIREKMYLSFLTGIELEKILNHDFDFSFIERSDIMNLYGKLNTDSLYHLEQIRISGELVSRQIRRERGRLLPVAGIEAFAGGNQFTERFDPLNAGKWYGSSFAGLSVKIPVAGGDISGNRIRELRLREKAIELNYNDELKKTLNRSLILIEEIKQLSLRIEAETEVLILYRENLSLYRERFENGLMSADEILDYDLEFRIEKLRFGELSAELMAKKIDAVRQSGNMERFIRELR